MEEFEPSEMYILPGNEIKVEDYEFDKTNSPITVQKNADKVFACYVCNEILPWSHVSSRNMRPFLEGQMYICDRCDNKNMQNVTSSNRTKVDNDTLQAAILESVASQGINLGNSCSFNLSQLNSGITNGLQEKQKADKTDILKEDDIQDYARRRYECSLCSKRFKRNGHLQRHMRTHTTEEPIFKCDQCDKCYRDSYNLFRHKKLHQTDVPYDIKPYTCGICEKKFRDNFDLQRHVRIHTGEEPYKCDLCDKGFIDNRTLRKHIKQHKGEKLCICPICKKGFIDNRALNRHVKTYKGAAHYKCDICDKTFNKSGDVLFHMKIHTEEPQFKCEFCGEAFRSENNFIMHRKIHIDQISSYMVMTE